MRPVESIHRAVMESAWRDFLTWLASDPKVVAAFNEETGRQWQASRSAIEAMIDRATGKDDADMMAFLVWATDQFGWEYAPYKFREAAGRAAPK